MAESSSGVTSILVLVVFVVVFALFILLLMRTERSRGATLKKVLGDLGFSETPVAAPGAPNHMQEQLERLYRRSPTQKFELRQLFEKAGQRGNYYIFQLIETSGSENTYLGSNAMAVFSPDLRLPHAQIRGRMIFDGKTAGWMAAMAEKVVDWAGSQGGYIRLSLTNYPDIDQKLIVMVEDETEARATFTPDRLRRLTWLADMAKLSDILCEGNCFVLERQTTPRKPNQEKDYAALLQDTTSAWNVLR